MYNALLVLHNLLRWVVLIAALVVIYQSYMGWKNNKPFARSLKTAATVFISSMDTQLLLGLLLYFVYSPIVKAATADMKNAMHDRSLRFWSVEHITMMMLAVVLAHVGYIKSKKHRNEGRGQKTLFTFTLLSLILILVAIPFGLINEWRPLFRW